MNVKQQSIPRLSVWSLTIILIFGYFTIVNGGYIGVVRTESINLGYATVTGRYFQTTSPNPNNSTKLDVKTWLGIPYAQPPIGDLRFRQAKPISTNLGSLNTTEFGDECMQNRPASPLLLFAPDTSSKSEDCLTLNIFTPPHARELLTSYPVMVFVHGGSGTYGGSADTLFDGVRFVANSLNDTPVIFVSFNYRLNVFGYLASKELASENALNIALLDQRFVFKWVQAYISKFGGNPNSITVFGQSSGATSIGAHMVANQTIIQNISSKTNQHTKAYTKKSNNNNGGGKAINAVDLLFDKAILQSDSGKARTVSASQPFFDSVVKQLNCDTSTAKVNCLRQVSASDLLAAGANHQGSFDPVIDGVYITQSPILAFKKGEYMKIPIIIGSVTDEGTAFEVLVLIDSAYQSFLDGFEGGKAVRDKINSLYRLADYENSYFKLASAVEGDYNFICAVKNQSDSYATSQTPATPVYRYRFNHQMTNPSILFWVSNQGVFHQSELYFLFDNQNALDNSPSSKEPMLALTLHEYWTRFAAYGNPNGGKHSLGYWPVYKPVGGDGKSGGVRFLINDGGVGGVVNETDTTDLIKCGFWMDFWERYRETPATYP
ncbi:hypothetical protein HDU76_003929 [Blyttiomyces sp. JEL0837]|nr:hypothetical protein HDU76_003929 [Blyttiomyces sp. JEL0837]